MTKYCVACCSLMDGELNQYILEAESKYVAMALIMELDNEIMADYSTEESLYELASNWDSFISAIEI